MQDTALVSACSMGQPQTSADLSMVAKRRLDPPPAPADPPADAPEARFPPPLRPADNSAEAAAARASGGCSRRPQRSFCTIARSCAHSRRKRRAAAAAAGARRGSGVSSASQSAASCGRKETPCVGCGVRSLTAEVGVQRIRRCGTIRKAHSRPSKNKMT